MPSVSIFSEAEVESLEFRVERKNKNEGMKE